MELPPSSHFIYIPVLLILGVVLGFVWGARATREAVVLEARAAEERAQRKAARAARHAAEASPPEDAATPAATPAKTPAGTPPTSGKTG